MGMTIEEALKELNRVILCLTDGGNVTKEVNALEIVISTMRKYQKIEQITRDFQQIHPHYGDSYYLQIREVIEDANNKQAN